MTTGFRKIPKKNYIVLGVVILVTILILYYFYLWTQVYKETKLNMRIMDNYMEVINYNELDNYLVESPNTIIYVSVLENSEIRDFEKKFKSSFKKHELNYNILYMDITTDIKNNNISSLFNKYNINGIRIDSLPFILVIQDGYIKDVYMIQENEYDIASLVEFINNINIGLEVGNNG